ncbi:MAG: hypothetical protein K2O39_03055, partial [Clostridiales bacterium]|nr:hypothetical protein [Clostridiales bacterium]
NSDGALYDLIMGDKLKGCSTAEKASIEKIVLVKKKCKITDDELKKVINQMGFPDFITREERLFFIHEQLHEQYGMRCNDE